MAKYKYLVSCLDRNRVVELYDKDNLEDKIRLEFQIEPSTRVTIEKFDNEWEDFVEITSSDELPDKAKLRVKLNITLPIIVSDPPENTNQLPVESIAPEENNVTLAAAAADTVAFTPSIDTPPNSNCPR